jgi:hypothetical protein
MCLAVDFWTHNNISHPDALSRVLLHFFPVVPTLIVLLNAQYFGGRR